MPREDQSRGQVWHGKVQMAISVTAIRRSATRPESQPAPPRPSPFAAMNVGADGVWISRPLCSFAVCGLEVGVPSLLGCDAPEAGLEKVFRRVRVCSWRPRHRCFQGGSGKGAGASVDRIVCGFAVRPPSSCDADVLPGARALLPVRYGIKRVSLENTTMPPEITP